MSGCAMARYLSNTRCHPFLLAPCSCFSCDSGSPSILRHIYSPGQHGHPAFSRTYTLQCWLTAVHSSFPGCWASKMRSLCTHSTFSYHSAISLAPGTNFQSLCVRLPRARMTGLQQSAVFTVWPRTADPPASISWCGVYSHVPPYPVLSVQTTAVVWLSKSTLLACVSPGCRPYRVCTCAHTDTHAHMSLRR